MEEALKNFDIYPWGAKFKVEYSEQDLRDIAIKHTWKGDGTKENPFIVENRNGLADMFCLKKSNLFIIIKNSDFKYLLFISSRNITLDNCSFLRLTLRKCRSFIIESCTIRNLSLGRSKYNTFSNCIVTREFIRFFSKINTFKNCVVESRELKSKSSDFTSPHIILLKTYTFVVLSVALFVFYSIYHSIYTEGSLNLATILSIIGLISLIIMGLLIWIFKSLIKKK